MFKRREASLPLTMSNQKRIDSCKLVGGAKKRGGHVQEEIFGARWCDSTPTTYNAEADKTITEAAMLDLLKKELGISSGRCSIKSGKNLQFTLGNIPEITDAEDKCSAISKRDVWEKYLGKGHSRSPADVLVYRDIDRWVFFNMTSVIDFISTKSTWRITKTGRIKGDFCDGSKKGVRQYLTYEYRNTHKSYFLGANGNRGREFINLLKTNLPHHQEVDK